MFVILVSLGGFSLGLSVLGSSSGNITALLKFEFQCPLHNMYAFLLFFFPGGDGLADIVGRRFGGVKLPWNSNKSWAGSLAMFIGVCFILLGCVVVCPPLGRTEGYSGGFSEDLRRSQCFVIGCPPTPRSAGGLVVD